MRKRAVQITPKEVWTRSWVEIAVMRDELRRRSGEGSSEVRDSLDREREVTLELQLDLPVIFDIFRLRSVELVLTDDDSLVSQSEAQIGTAVRLPEFRLDLDLNDSRGCPS